VFLPWNTTNVHFCTFVPERNSGFRVIYLGGAIAWDVAMPRRRINWKSEDVMAGLYLGIAVTSVNALVAMGIVIAFTGVGLF
jgi:hypothetical protein